MALLTLRQEPSDRNGWERHATNQPPEVLYGQVPAGTQPGTTLRLRGRGVPKLNEDGERGALTSHGGL